MQVPNCGSMVKDRVIYGVLLASNVAVMFLAFANRDWPVTYIMFSLACISICLLLSTFKLVRDFSAIKGRPSGDQRRRAAFI